jgi:hypothetical protein
MIKVLIDQFKQYSEKDFERYKKTVEKWRPSSGKNAILKILDGKVPTLKQAIMAKCADCTCGYADGLNDCEDIFCSLYFFMPFGKGKKISPKTQRNNANGVLALQKYREAKAKEVKKLKNQ